MKIKKKFHAGTARVFLSRKKALKKLQLSLKDFRKLCILKGIYPREPNRIKTANKGSTENKIFYHIKDINFLSQEPLLRKFRDYKVFLKKVTHARAKRDNLKLQQLLNSKPVFSYDHLVKERYPTFISALRDMDDALCLCFSFALLTQSKIAKLRVINQCRRLVTEFMHYVIEANALRKVFISIKGIYYQAEIMGEKITWIAGHERCVGRANELDFSAMANFVDFYSCMLSFVNYRLFKSIGLFYPPQLQQQTALENNYELERTNDLDDRIYSLAFPLKRTDKSDFDTAATIDVFTDELTEEPSLADKFRQIQTLKTLFTKMKFFLNREVPKESLAFVIRSCGGFVCWDGCSPNSISESSELITHQIIDRNVECINFNRVYIQPQWIFDCFNTRRILPTARYAPSSTLPPHLSPFMDDQQQVNVVHNAHVTTTSALKVQQKDKANAESDGISRRKEQKIVAGVHKSKVYKESQQKMINEEGHNLKLREMMIPKKQRRVYAKIRHGMKRKVQEENKLAEKRAKLSTEKRTS